MTLSEIAKLCGWSITSVHRYERDALEKLRALGEHGDPEQVAIAIFVVLGERTNDSSSEETDIFGAVRKKSRNPVESEKRAEPVVVRPTVLRRPVVVVASPQQQARRIPRRWSKP